MARRERGGAVAAAMHTIATEPARLLTDMGRAALQATPPA